MTASGLGLILAITGDQEVISSLSPIVQACTQGRGALTQSTFKEIGWLSLPHLTASLFSGELGLGGTGEGGRWPPSGSMAPAAPSLYLQYWSLSIIAKCCSLERRKRFCVSHLTLTPPYKFQTESLGSVMLFTWIAGTETLFSLCYPHAGHPCWHPPDAAQIFFLSFFFFSPPLSNFTFCSIALWLFLFALSQIQTAMGGNSQAAYWLLQNLNRSYGQ